MKILFLVPYPAGAAPSQRFRFEQYQNELRNRGFKVLTQSFWDEKSWSILYSSNKTTKKIIGLAKGLARRLKILFHVRKYDYVFIHRECLPIGPPILEWIIAVVLKKKIVYDFDDAIWLPNTTQENRIATIFKWHSKVGSICRWSYKISCGNSYLADYALKFNKSVVVNPTTIDTISLHNPDLHNSKTNNPYITIGWTGTHSTLQYLNPIIPVIQQLEKEYPIRFVIISNKRPYFKKSSVEFIQWCPETEIEDLLRFDIGIMPLKDDIWAKGKCGFKALQYMALGIPAVASSVGVNNIIIENRVDGFLCASHQEWLQSLTLLIKDKQIRNQMGLKARAKVIKTYSVESNLRIFLSLFS